MYEVPNAARPPNKSTATKVFLILGVVICLAAGAGIVLLGVQLASDQDTVATDPGGGTDPGGAPTSAAPSNAAGPHKMIDDPCAPLETVKTTPELTKMRPRAPKDYEYFTSAYCDAQSDKYEVTATVNIQVNNDTENLKGEDSAIKDYEAGVRVYSDKKAGIEEVSGVGDRAFAAPVSESEDTSWHLDVQSDNLGLRITGYTGKGKEADVELCKQIANAYLTATSESG